MEEKKQNHFTGDIIPILSKTETEALFDILSVNNKNLHLDLLYHPKKGQDQFPRAKAACAGKNPLLLLIETMDGYKFGGLKDTSDGTVSKGQSRICENFLFFSIDKNKVFNVDRDSFNITFQHWLLDFGIRTNFMTQPTKVPTKDLQYPGDEDNSVHRNDKDVPDKFFQPFENPQLVVKHYNHGKFAYLIKEMFIYEVEQEKGV